MNLGFDFRNDKKKRVEMAPSSSTLSGKFLAPPWLPFSQDDVALRVLMSSKLAPGQALGLIRQVGLRLAERHAQGSLPLNLQPELIRVGLDGSVRLETVEMLATTGAVNIAYASPEQHVAGLRPDERAGVYTLALLTYELLAGFNPFLGPTPAVSRLQHSYKVAPPLSTRNPAVSLGLEGLIAAALSKNPADRPELSGFLAGLELEAALAENQASAPTFASLSIPKLVAAHRQTLHEVQVFSRQRATAPLTLALPPSRDLLPNLPGKPARRQRRWVGGLALLVGVVALIGLSLPWLLPGREKVQPASTGPVVSTPVSTLPPVAGTTLPAVVPATVSDSSAPSPSVAPTDRWQTTLDAADRQIWEQGDFEGAIKVYQSVSLREPGYGPAYQRLGQAFYLWGRESGPTGAIETLKKAVALRPQDAQGWATLALVYQEAYQYDRGLDAAAMARRLNPHLAQAQAAEALLLLRLGETDRAAEGIKEALDLNPADFWARWAAVTIAKSSEQALPLLDQLLADYPRLALLYSAKGDLLRQRGPGSGGYDAALSLYEQALKLDEGFPSAYNGRAWVYLGQNRFPEAEAAFGRILKIRPDHARSLTGLGYLKLSQRQPDAAIGVFSRAIQADPREAEAYNGLAAAYLNKSEPAQVGLWADLALKYAPRYGDAFYNKGQALYLLKNYKEATEAFQQAVQIGPTQAGYQEGLAFAAQAAGDTVIARRAALESLRLKPDNLALAELLKGLGSGD